MIFSPSFFFSSAIIEIDQQDEISVFPYIITTLDLNYMVSNNLLPFPSVLRSESSSDKSHDKQRCIDPNIVHNLSVKVFESPKLFSFHGICKRKHLIAYTLYNQIP